MHFRVKGESITILRIRKEREMEESLINRKSNKKKENNRIRGYEEKKRATKDGCFGI